MARDKKQVQKPQGMSKQEKLRDREQQKAGLLADKDQMIRTVNSRHRRTQLVRQAAKRVRDAREFLALAVRDIELIRSASQHPGGAIYAKIDERDAGIARVNRELVTLRAEARIEKLMQMMAEVNKLEKELAVGNPDAIGEDDIVG